MAEASNGTRGSYSPSSSSRKQPLYKALSRFNKDLNRLGSEEKRERLRSLTSKCMVKFDVE